MARVVADPDSRRGDRFVLEGDAFNHAVKVLRTEVGQRLLVVDGSGVEYECVAHELTSRALVARIVRARRLPGAPRVGLHLFTALLKGDKLDLVLQKCTELGVERLTLYRAERSTLRIAAEDEASRRARWTRIVQAAVGQSGHHAMPSVEGPISYADALERATRADLAIIPWEGDGVQHIPRLSDILTAHPRAASVAVVVGPEGGFSATEIAAAQVAGLCPVTLGPRILRAETAAVVVPALVLAAYGDLG